MLTPQFRFKKADGTDFPDWETKRLSEIFTEISEKGHPELPVLSVQQGFGTVLRDSSNRKIEYNKDNLKNYKAMKKDDFIIHLRTFEGGLECANQDGISSPAYKILRSKGINIDLYKAYFRSYNFIEGVLAEAVVGIRDGKNIDMDIFWDIEIPYPSLEEQEKMAECFHDYDALILHQMETIDILQKRRNAIVQQIFSQEIRFKADDGSEFPEWEETLLSEVLSERKGKSTGKEEVFSVSVSKGLVNQVEHLGRSFAAEDTSKYKVVCPGDVVYTKSPTGEFKWGIVKQSMIDKDVIVSPLYGIFTPKNEAIGFVIDAYFSSKVRAHNYLITQVRKGAKNTINVSNDEFLDNYIVLPTTEAEAQKIKDFIVALDQQIQIEKDKLEAIKNVKKGLLQQMFV